MDEDGRLREVSPTLVVALCRCALAVRLTRSRRTTAGSFPSGPSTRLGATAYRVLVWVADGAMQREPTELEAAVGQRWNEEVFMEEKAAGASPQESYFGPADQWPSFATTQERFAIEAQRLVAELSQAPETEHWVERTFSCSNPPMHGLPDFVQVDERAARFIEVKTGNIEAVDVQPAGRYWLQVLRYAAMVREIGKVVTAAEIRPIGRASFTVGVRNVLIDVDLEVSRTSLGEFNAAIEIETTTGTVRGSVILTGLEERRLPLLYELKPGDRVRVSGLRRCPGRSAPGARSGAWMQLTRVGGSAAFR